MILTKRRVLLCALLLVILADPTNASTGELSRELVRFDFWGFSIAPQPLEVGDELRLVGVINPSTTVVPIPLEFDTHEYTVYVYGLRLETVLPNGPLIQYEFSGGVAEIYGDASFNAPFQANSSPEAVPPLDPREVPAHFIDGDLMLRFAFRDFISLFYEPAGIGSIAYTATEMRASGGKSYPDLHRLHMVIGWHMGGGYTDDEGAHIPEGYGMRYDTLFQWENPLPVDSATWGGIKASFK